MKLNFLAKLLVGGLIAAALGALSLAQTHASPQDRSMPASGLDRQKAPQGTLVALNGRLELDNSMLADEAPATPGPHQLPRSRPSGSTAASHSAPAALSTPSGGYAVFLPGILFQPSSPTPISTKPEPPAVTPKPGWPDGRDSQSGSKLGLHIVRNNDPYIMEYVRRVRPRVMKSVDDLGWLSDVKLASPNTVTIGRISGQNEDWPEQLAPDAAAQQFIAGNLDKYHLNPGVDYWEGWNEFVPVTQARWQWYAAFEAARACDMQALGLRAAIGGFAAGTPEYNEMPYFLPALEAAHRCGAIFTLHEGVSPLPLCGIFTDQANVIPGAPEFPGVTLGYLMLRYRFWYEGYLKPMGLGDVPLEISEVAVGGIVPGQPCNGPGGAGWKAFSDFWVQHGVGPDGPHAWTNLLSWYDAQLSGDPYVLGTTIFTAGGEPSWDGTDLHDVIIPLAEYETAAP